MRFCSVLGLVIVTLCLVQSSHALDCFICIGRDPDCGDADRTRCITEGFCYKIILRSLGVAVGCAQSEDYCLHMSNRIGPIVQTCMLCSTDNCNSASSDNLFHSLLVFGVTINIVLLVTYRF